MKTLNFSHKIDGDDNVIDKFSVNPPNVYGFGHQAYYEHVVDSINNNKPPMIDGHEGLKSLKLINAIYESIETGNEVFLDYTSQYSKLGR